MTTEPTELETAQAHAEAWRRKAIDRGLKLSKAQGTVTALIDLMGEDFAGPGERGDGYRQAQADLREVLTVFGHVEQTGGNAAPLPAADMLGIINRTTADLLKGC